jgi:hypothetical protein
MTVEKPRQAGTACPVVGASADRLSAVRQRCLASAPAVPMFCMDRLTHDGVNPTKGASSGNIHPIMYTIQGKPM